MTVELITITETQVEAMRIPGHIITKWNLQEQESGAYALGWDTIEGWHKNSPAVDLGDEYEWKQEPDFHYNRAAGGLALTGHGWFTTGIVTSLMRNAYYSTQAFWQAEQAMRDYVTRAAEGREDDDRGGVETGPHGSRKEQLIMRMKSKVLPAVFYGAAWRGAMDAMRKLGFKEPINFQRKQEGVAKPKAARSEKGKQAMAAAEAAVMGALNVEALLARQEVEKAREEKATEAFREMVAEGAPADDLIKAGEALAKAAKQKATKGATKAA